MSESTPTSAFSVRTLMLILLPLLGMGLVVGVMLATRTQKKSVVTVVMAADAAGTTAINTGQVLDTTVPEGEGIVPRLGYRYKVLVSDESDDRSSGIAKIGNQTMFSPDARRGQTVLVDVTRVKERVVDAVLVRIISTTTLPPRVQRPTFVPPAGDPVLVGAEMDVVISEASSKNPDTESIARIGGLVVIVNGVTTIGQRVNVRITDRRERMAFAEPTGKPAGAGPLPSISAQPQADRGSRAPRNDRTPAPSAFTPREGDSAAFVMPGAVIMATIAEPSLKNPETEGVAKVEGLVIFVKGATEPGQEVFVRITARNQRAANGEVTSDPVTAGPDGTCSF